MIFIPPEVIFFQSTGTRHANGIGAARLSRIARDPWKTRLSSLMTHSPAGRMPAGMPEFLGDKAFSALP